MDFEYSDDQRAIADLAGQIFRDRVDDGYHAGLGEDWDRALWQTLAGAGLLGVSLSEQGGGSDLGFIGACLVLREMGAVLAPLPLQSSLVAAMALDEADAVDDAARMAAGETWLAASADPGLALAGERVQGELSSVAFARGAGGLVAVAHDQLVWIELDGPGAELADQQLTNGLPACHVRLDGPCRVLGGSDAAARLRQRLQVATTMQQLGVLGEALARTAAFTVERSQFGQPLARFQAVSQRAADGYIDIEALRATAESAMWRLHEGLDAGLEAGAALWWAAEAGHRVAHTAQHLHGGIGADRDYPIHRFFLWAKQLEFSQGGAAHCAAAMGEHLAANATSGGRK